MEPLRLSDGWASLWKQREAPDPDAVRLDHHDASVLERAGELRQVGSEQLRLIGGLVLASVSKQDYRWRTLLPGREERSEISVRRDDHSALSVGMVEDLLV